MNHKKPLPFFELILGPKNNNPNNLNPDISNQKMCNSFFLRLPPPPPKKKTTNNKKKTWPCLLARLYGQGDQKQAIIVTHGFLRHSRKSSYQRSHNTKLMTTHCNE